LIALAIASLDQDLRDHSDQSALQFHGAVESIPQEMPYRYQERLMTEEVAIVQKRLAVGDASAFV